MVRGTMQKEAQLMRVMSAKALSGQGGQSRSNSGRTSSGRPVHAGVQHGNVLFKPLPEPEAHQEAQHQQQHSSEGPLAQLAAALNPTYTFGEHKTEEVQKEAHLMHVMSAKVLSGQGGQSRSNSGRTSSGRPVHAGVQHGEQLPASLSAAAIATA
ncbi:hypothetical protein QJQ45_000935 [Haematococcus lacustris]|nr:hypothetical protein QJQ45_000935 [Haematococcus lacustris]